MIRELFVNDSWRILVRSELDIVHSKEKRTPYVRSFTSFLLSVDLYIYLLYKSLTPLWIGVVNFPTILLLDYSDEIHLVRVL